MKIFSTFVIFVTLCFSGVVLSDYKIFEGENPFPWGSELPFPWESIEGVWIAEAVGETDPEAYRLYSFEVISEGESERNLRVYELDSVEMQVIASGLGSEFDKIVRAAMKMNHDNYTMVVRAFPLKEETVTSWGSSDMILALSIRTKGEFGAPSVINYFAMSKISSLPIKRKCSEGRTSLCIRE